MRLLKRLMVLFAVSLLTLLGVRAYDAWRSASLEPWHTYTTDELHAEQLATLDWSAYLRAEDAVFEGVRTHVTQRLDADERVPVNRYFDGSPVYPGRFAHDWNRSFILEPDGPPSGAVVFLHGLTDSPYSMRRLAQRYRAHGFVAVVIRLPAHGTVPGALAEVEWPDWTAATRLAVREARRRGGAERPLHVVGYSNGGALALQYALDAIDDAQLPRPDRVVLLSPMIGITRLARFAGIVGLPALLPPFAKAAWLSVMPEFNPFKYNSFPVNAARQTSLLTGVLQEQITRLARADRLAALPPILTFQSLADFTVSTRAIVDALYVHLPANGSELVLFDLNRNAKLGPLLRASYATKIARLLPAAPRRFRTAVLTNADPDSRAVVERVVEAGATDEQSHAVGLSYPDDVYSLSHIAVPFPPDDGLYGIDPDPNEDYGIRLGTIAPRGERATLIVSIDSLIRLTSNPFFAYMRDRIEAGIGAPAH